MAKDEDYIELEAVVRMPKGERLADSKADDGIESADVSLGPAGEDEVIAALSARPRPPRR